MKKKNPQKTTSPQKFRPFFLFRQEETLKMNGKANWT